MKNFRITSILIIAIILIGGVYLIFPEYLRNTLVYQFANIDDYEIFDNRTVIASAHDPWEEPAGYNTGDIPEEYEEDFDKLNTVAFLVIKNQKILFEKYWDDYSDESLSNSFSMAKSIVSLLVGIAIDEGSIKSVDQAVGDFLPGFSEGQKAKLKIRHLLEMSSGLSWKDSYFNPFSKTAKAYYGSDLRELVINLENEKEPGVKFEYKNCNPQILALILKEATGMSISAYASQKLWKTMGARQDALWSLDDINGIEKAFCCFNSNARDFARFGQLILNNGKWDGRRIISSDYLENALKPVSHLKDKHEKAVDYYGWQWWIQEYKDQVIYSMRGLKGQYVFVIPDRDMVIVRLGRKSSKVMIDNVLPSDILIWLDAGFKIAG